MREPGGDNSKIWILQPQHDGFNRLRQRRRQKTSLDDEKKGPKASENLNDRRKIDPSHPARQAKQASSIRADHAVLELKSLQSFACSFVRCCLSVLARFTCRFRST